MLNREGKQLFTALHVYKDQILVLANSRNGQNTSQILFWTFYSENSYDFKTITTENAQCFWPWYTVKYSMCLIWLTRVTVREVEILLQAAFISRPNLFILGHRVAGKTCGPQRCYVRCSDDKCLPQLGIEPRFPSSPTRSTITDWSDCPFPRNYLNESHSGIDVYSNHEPRNHHTKSEQQTNCSLHLNF